METKEEYIKRFEEFEQKGGQELLKLEVQDFTELKNLISKYTSSQIKVLSANLRHSKLMLTSEKSDSELLLRSEFIPSQTLVIERIAVTPKHSGIGSAILNWLINYSKDKGFERIILENCNTEDSINFALSKGFSKCYNPILEWMPGDREELLTDYQISIN
ncbi:GNAT family N-acetyltransferase [Piscibacillus sp. B03]|uniref:GNAT family N-acetyltransferase n=1 Tax=Piscibacillus sp. B03 TaxID=3457430 RepID=UPI003FCCCDC8